MAVRATLEDLVVVALAHAFATFTIAGPQQPVAEHVAVLQLADDFAVAMVRTRFVHDGLMDVRIEVGAERLDRTHAVLPQQVVQLRVNQLDALAVAVGLRPASTVSARSKSSTTSSSSASRSTIA